MAFKILNVFGNHLTPAAEKILNSLGTVDPKIVTQDQIAKIIDRYEAIFMGLYPELPKKVLQKAKNLKVITTATTNLDHIDLDYARQRGITVLSLKEEIAFLNTITGTAEMAMGLMIDLLRFSPWAFVDVKNYHWRRERFRGHNLYGHTLGIVGLGRLGKWMARYGQAFNMRVIAHDPYISKSAFAKAKCASVSFDTLLQQSDIISIHVHLTPETKHLFNQSAFKKMKNSAYLINTAIREVVKEDDLLTALKKGEIAGYGADVLADELWFDKSFKNHPLVEYAKKNQNVIILPHIGGMTHESRQATDIFMANKLKNFIWQKKF